MLYPFNPSIGTVAGRSRGFCPGRRFISTSGGKPLIPRNDMLDFIPMVSNGATGLYSELSQKGLNLCQDVQDMLITSNTVKGQLSAVPYHPT